MRAGSSCLETSEGKGRASRAAVGGRERRKQGPGGGRPGGEGRTGSWPQGGEDFHLSTL